MSKFTELRESIHRCRHCQASVSHQLKPVVILPAKAKIVLISQAPGRLAHESGLAWNDASGDRLREWLAVTRDEFYAEKGGLGNFAVLPMSFCFPGYVQQGQQKVDAPPLKPCKKLWHEQVLQFYSPELIIFIGRYAQQAYLPQFPNLTDAIFSIQDLLPNMAALPHPSGRNNRWLSKYPSFQEDVLGILQLRVAQILKSVD